MPDSIIVLTPTGGQGKTLISQILGAFSRHQLVSVDRASYGKSKLGRLALDVREFDLVRHNADFEEDSDFFIDLVTLFLSRPCIVDFGANLSDEFFAYLKDGFVSIRDSSISNLVFVVPMTSDIQSQKAASDTIEQIGALPFFQDVKIVVVMNEVRGPFELTFDKNVLEMVSKVVSLPLCSSSYLRHFEEKSVGLLRGFYFLKNMTNNKTMDEISEKMSYFTQLDSRRKYFTFLKKSYVNVFSQIVS